MAVRRSSTVLCVALAIAGCGGEKWTLSSGAVSTTSTTVTTTTVTKTTTPARSGGVTTTTASELLGPFTEADAEAGNQALFDDDRAALEATFRAQPDPKLTALSYNAHANTVSVVFAYTDRSRPSRSRYDDFAWQTAQTISDSFWFPELVKTFPSHHADPAWLPRLRIQLDRVVYLCPALVQIAVAARRIAQHDWLARCPG
jgi:hypothetical protein